MNTSGDNVGVFVYDSTDDSCVEVYTNGRNWSAITPIGDNRFLMGGWYAPLVVYDATDNSVIDIDANRQWLDHKQVSDTKYLVSNGQSTMKGLWVYNTTDNSFTNVFNDGYNFKYYVNVGDRWLVSTYSTSYLAGIVMYNALTDEAKLVYDKLNSWQYSHTIGNKCLISCTTGSSGLLLYNSETDQCSQIYTGGASWMYFQDVGTKCLIGSSSSNTGVLRYDSTNDSCIQIYSSGSSWRHFVPIETKCLFSGSSSSGLYLYNAEDDGVVLLSNIGGYAWARCQKVSDNKYLILSVENGGGVVLFNTTTDTATKPFSKGYGYDTFTHDIDNNYYISSSSDKKNAPYTLYYTEATDSITVAKYYLGEI